MPESAFGVTHADDISKAMGPMPRMAAGSSLKSKLVPNKANMKRFGNDVKKNPLSYGGGAAVGTGAILAGKKIQKSAFDVEHEVEKGMFSMPGSFRAAAQTAAQKPMAMAGKLKPKPGGTAAGMMQNAKPFAAQNKKAIAGGAAAGGAGAAGAMSMKPKQNKPPTNRV